MTELERLIKENRYIRDVLDGPSAIWNSTDFWEQTDQISAIAEKLNSFHYSKVLLTGMGSSLNALYPLYCRLLQHGIQVCHIETSELLNYSNELITEDCLTVIVSQSGESIEIQKLLDNNGLKGLTIGITNTYQSTLYTKSNCSLLTQAGNETSVSCKTYLAALAATTILGDILLKEDSAMTIDALRSAAQEIEKYYVNSKGHIHKLIDLLSETKYLVVTGRGMSIASANTAALVIKESSKFFAEGMSSAAFRHGPFEIILSGLFLVVFSGDRRVYELNKKLVDDVNLCGGKAVLVERGKECDPFIVPEVSDSILPIVEILPAQMLSIALSVLHKHEPGKFDLISKVTLTE